LPEGLYSLHMLVVPKWGLYANMLAQFVAQLSSHIIIHYHLKSVKAATQAQQDDWGLKSSDDDLESTERLRCHSYRLDYEASDKCVTTHKGVDWVLTASMVTFVLLVICGCAVPSFSIETLGLVGLAVESGNQFQQAYVEYSVFDLASVIMGQGRFLNTASDRVGMGTLASLLIITILLVPLFQAVSLLANWFAPLTRKRRSRNEVLNEIMSAWQYMEVYVLSILIAAWQLGGVSEYMINEYCEALDSTFNSLAYYGLLKEDDAQCFRINVGVKTGTWLLVAASVVLYVLGKFISGATSQKKLDDETPSERRFYSDRWMTSKQSDLTADQDLTVGMDVSQSMSTDNKEDSSEAKISISPITPRFTDYFSFAVKHKNLERESDQIETVETVVPPNESRLRCRGSIHEIIEVDSEEQ